MEDHGRSELWSTTAVCTHEICFLNFLCLDVAPPQRRTMRWKSNVKETKSCRPCWRTRHCQLTASTLQISAVFVCCKSVDWQYCHIMAVWVLTWWNEQDMYEIWTFWTSTQEIEQEKSQLMEQKEAAAIATASSCQLPWLNGRDRSRRWFASWKTCIAPAPKQGFRPQTVRQLSGHPATHSNTRNAVQMAI